MFWNIEQCLDFDNLLLWNAGQLAAATESLRLQSLSEQKIGTFVVGILLIPASYALFVNNYHFYSRFRCCAYS